MSDTGGSRNLMVIMVIICGTAVLGPMAFEMVLPAMPTVVEFYGVEAGAVELSIGLMLVGMGGGQLFIGPLADRYGRRRMLAAGLLLYAFTSAALAFLPTFGLFLVVRFLQGLSTATFVLLSRTIIRDLFSSEQAARLLSILYIALGASSVLSPIIGAQLLTQLGWQSVFLVLAVLGVIFLWVSLAKLPETAPPRGDDTRGLTRLLINYMEILRNRIFVSYLAVNCCFSLGLIAFVSASAPVYVEHLGISPQAYGFAFSFVFLGAVSGSAVSTRVVVRAGIQSVLLAATLIAAAAGIAQAALSIAGAIDHISLSVTMFLFMFAFSLGSPQTVAAALTPFTTTAGTASSIYGVIQLMTASIGSFLLALFADGTHRPLVTGIAIAGIASLTLYYWLVRPLAARKAVSG